ncbi:MAG: DUF2974 domain-containing protein [Eubacteriales bacterium]|nr:DUF2974 domain-containing protein [Eubacteriales bacterium]
MFEYLKWRDDLSFSVSPVCEIDALIFSQLSYLHFRDALGTGSAPLSDAAGRVTELPQETGNAQVVASRHQLLLAVKDTVRFGSLTVGFCEDRFDPELNMQFAAAAFTLPDGSHIIAYRGTDATVVGWREDFNMSFACPVPSQSAALAYLTRVAAATRGPLRLCGHSKGGNLALYAAACCTPEVRARIGEIYLFDAPGLDKATLSTGGYREALPKVRCYVPQNSLIGQMMGVPPAYTVVRSRAVGLAQHNVFTWALDGPRFVTLPRLNQSSRLMKATLDEFLQTSTPDTRQMFVETLFSLLGAGNAHTLGEVAGSWTDAPGALISALRSLDPETRKTVLSVAGTLAASGMETAKQFITAYREQNEAAKPAGNTAHEGITRLYRAGKIPHRHPAGKPEP